MRYVKWLSHYTDSRESAVTFGKFDGLHLGHQKLIQKVQELKREKHVISLVCAFDMRPLWRAKHLHKERLMTGRERIHHLDGEVDYLLECPFTETFRNITAESFIRDVICNRFHAKYVVVGTDFHFGKDQGGDIHMLEEYSKKYGYELVVVEKERYCGHVISSTYIRDVLKKGNLPLTNYLLGYPFEINGRIERGRQLGRTLGFPTMNVAWPEYKLVPPKGVYISEITIDGIKYPGISNIGVRPTVAKDNKVVLESFLFHFSEDAYGKKVKVELLEFTRPEQKFESVEEMKACVDKDILYAKKYFGIE
ncbi:MAG: bifunctional riboflavin kinase/FAD synthetase [Lachnospiraceae bacterium]